MSETPHWVERVTGEFTPFQIYRAMIDAEFIANEAAVVLNRLQYNRQLAEGELMSVEKMMRTREVIGLRIKTDYVDGVITDFSKIENDWVFVIDGRLYRVMFDHTLQVFPKPVADGRWPITRTYDA